MTKTANLSKEELLGKVISWIAIVLGLIVIGLILYKMIISL